MSGWRNLLLVLVIVLLTGCGTAGASYGVIPGRVTMQQCLGGAGSDMGKSAWPTTDGGYIVAGQSQSNDIFVTGNHGGWDVWIVKVSPSGTIDWQRSLGGSSVDIANSIQQTTDGGYIVAGYTGSNDGDVAGNHGSADYWVVKLTPSGTIAWQRCLGGSGADQANSILQTADGGYVVAGTSRSNDGNVTGNHGGADYWVVKLTPAGNLDWQNSVGGLGDDTANSILQKADGGYVVAGISNSNDGNVTPNHGGDDYWIVGLTPTGSLGWQLCLGGSGSDFAYDIRQTTDGGFIIAGSSNSLDGMVTGNHGGYDFWVVKLSAVGGLDWQKSLGGTGTDYGYSVIQARDGEYVVTGASMSGDGDVNTNNGGFDFWVVQLTSSGTIDWQISPWGNFDDLANSIRQTADGDYLIAGYTTSTMGGYGCGNHGESDYWVVKIGEGTVNFSANVTTGATPLAVHFTGIFRNIYTPRNWTWSFGDGGTATGQEADHTYTAPGTYAVTVRVYDGTVSWAETRQDWYITITPPPGKTPGGIAWQRSYGSSSHETPYSIQQTADGGYIVAGRSSGNDGDVTGHHGLTSSNDYWVVKLASSGTIEWQRSLGGSYDDYVFTIQQTMDGGYIVAGYSYSNDGDVSGHHGSTGFADSWVVKLTSSGTIEWQNSLGGSGNDAAASIQQTTDGGYIVAGSTGSSDGDVSGNHGYQDGWVVKLAPSGTIEWQKCLGGLSSDLAYDIQQTTDGGYIVALNSDSNDGNVTGNHGYADYVVVKLTSYGTIEWQKSLGGSSYDNVRSIRQTTDGGYIVAGYSNSNDGNVTGNHGEYDYWVVRLTSSGNIEWQKSLGGSGHDEAASIRQTTDGGYIIAGWSESNDGDVTGNYGSSDYWVVKLTTYGTIDWQKSLGGLSSDGAKSIQQTADGGYIVAGDTSSNDGNVTGNHGSFDYWVVKLNADGQADFGSDITSGISPLTVRFTGIPGAIVAPQRWEWDFGDGEINNSGRIVVHTYTAPGDYTVRLTVYDVNDEPAEAVKERYVHVASPLGIPLRPGWNFVSTPLTLAAGQNTAAVVFGGVNTAAHSVYLYNASRGGWDTLSAGSPVRPLDGIWIYSDRAMEVPLTFSDDLFLPFPDKHLYTGWNAIGYTGREPASAAITLSNIEGSWLRAISFNATYQRFDNPIAKGDISPTYGQNRPMNPTYGYWLLVNDNTTLMAFGI